MNKTLLKITTFLCCLAILPSTLIASEHRTINEGTKTKSYNKTHISGSTTVNKEQNQVTEPTGDWENQGSAYYKNSTTLETSDGKTVTGGSTFQDGQGTTIITTSGGKTTTLDSAKTGDNSATVTNKNTGKSVDISKDTTTGDTTVAGSEHSVTKE